MLFTLDSINVLDQFLSRYKRCSVERPRELHT